jgi:hypothetical protein
MATSEAEQKTKDSELRPEVFDDYDAFLKQAIRDYYDRGWKSRRGNFIALVIASGQVGSMAADSIRDGSGFRATFQETQGGYRAGRYDAASRNLMVDGLLKRFLEEIDVVEA